jgi:hypothetical protein
VATSPLPCQRLVAFTIHQHRAGPDKEDGVFFQQQVVYRNQGSSVGAFWTPWENLLGLAIQGKHQHTSRRTKTNDPCSSRYLRYWYLLLSVLLESSSVR